MTPSAADVERFWSKIDATGICWEWTRGLNAHGYGTFAAKRKTYAAHRFAWTHLVGEIPKGLVLDHLCLNKRCVNPDHLEPVTIAENVMRGNGAGARHARMTKCHRGHPFTPENTYVFRTQRQCRACRKIRDEARKAAANG